MNRNSFRFQTSHHTHTAKIAIVAAGYFKLPYDKLNNSLYYYLLLNYIV